MLSSDNNNQFNCIVDEKPTKRNVLIKLAPINAKWHSIGNGIQ